MFVGPTLQTSATTANDFSNVVTYIVEASDNTRQNYYIDVTKFTGLPIVYINTLGEAEITSKDEYISATISIDGSRNFQELAQTNIRIRGRGNSTWETHPKKPYQIRFNDKTSILGMPEDRRWLLLAEYSDKSMMRNKVVHVLALGSSTNLVWTPTSEYAEVYLNGEYNGTYNISQKVEQTANRLDIGDQGFLLEIDQMFRLKADDVYFRSEQFLLNIKEPNVAENDDNYNFIETYISDFENALYGSNFKNLTTGYAKYIVVDSVVDWYLINEITKNVDSKFFF